MKPVKYVWCIVVAVLCFFLLLGVGWYCLKKWGTPAQYQGGVLIKQEQALQDDGLTEDSASIEAIVRMEAVRAVQTNAAIGADAAVRTDAAIGADATVRTGAAAGEDKI